MPKRKRKRGKTYRAEIDSPHRIYITATKKSVARKKAKRKFAKQLDVTSEEQW